MYNFIQVLFGKSKGVFILRIEELISDPSVTEMCFWDVATVALNKGVVCLGYKVKDEEFMPMAEWMNEGAEEGITWINPDDKYTPRKWQVGDQLIVIANP